MTPAREKENCGTDFSITCPYSDYSRKRGRGRLPLATSNRAMTYGRPIVKRKKKNKPPPTPKKKKKKKKKNPPPRRWKWGKRKEGETSGFPIFLCPRAGITRREKKARRGLVRGKKEKAKTILPTYPFPYVAPFTIGKRGEKVWTRPRPKSRSERRKKERGQKTVLTFAVLNRRAWQREKKEHNHLGDATPSISRRGGKSIHLGGKNSWPCVCRSKGRGLCSCALR